MKVGDRVRCTLGDSVLVGVVDWMGRVGDDNRLHLSVANDVQISLGAAWQTEVIAPALPPEPPVGTALIDCFEAIWHHRDGGWYRTGVDGSHEWQEVSHRPQLTQLTPLIPATQVIEDVREVALHQTSTKDYIAKALATKYGVRL